MKIKAISSANSWYQLLLLGLIFVVAICVRIWTLFHVGDFAWDEMFSFYYSQKSWGELLKVMLWETNPPLHLFFLKNYFYLLPTTELWARLPSLLVGIVSLPLIYSWTKKLFSHQTALLATIFLAIHPFAIYASVLNRIYSTLVLLALLSYYFFQKIFFGEENKKSKHAITFFIITQFFLFFSHLTFIFIICAQIITLTIFARTKIKKYILLNLIPGFIWSIWFIPSWYLKIKAPDIGSSWFFNIEKSANPFASVASVFSNTPYAWLNIFFLCLIIISIGKIIYQQIKSRQINLNFWLVLIPVALTITLALIGNLWQAKFFMIVLPFIAIITAYSIEKILPKSISLIVVTIFATMSCLYWTQTLPLSDWAQLNTLLKIQNLSSTKQVIVDSNFVNWIYYPRYHTAPQKYLIYRSEQIDWDELIITQNYRFYRRPIEPAIDWLKKVGEHYDEIIVYQDSPIGVDLKSALDSLGWKQTYIFPITNRTMKKDLILYSK